MRLAVKPWSRLEDISIDYAVMERARNLSVMPCGGTWSDLGDWQAIWREGKADSDVVVASGPSTALDCKAPSNLASIGRYVLTPDIFDILRNQPVGSGGEIQLADAINTQALRGDVGAVRLNGLRFDCGSVDGYLDAIMQVAEQRRRG